MLESGEASKLLVFPVPKLEWYGWSLVLKDILSKNSALNSSFNTDPCAKAVKCGCLLKLAWAYKEQEAFWSVRNLRAAALLTSPLRALPGEKNSVTERTEPPAQLVWHPLCFIWPFGKGCGICSGHTVHMEGRKIKCQGCKEGAGAACPGCLSLAALPCHSVFRSGPTYACPWTVSLKNSHVKGWGRVGPRTQRDLGMCTNLDFTDIL